MHGRLSEGTGHVLAHSNRVDADLVHTNPEKKTMKQFRHFPAFFLTLLLASLMAGCASTDTQESFGEYVDDTVITSRVKAALFNDPTLSGFEVNVETFKGRVQLSGFVSSQADINKAVQIARGVKGVTAVQNDMRIK